MNGIIYRITAICLVLIVIGCKKESVRRETQNSVLSINDITLIKLQDTLKLDYNGEDLGEEIDFGKKDFQYKSLLFDKIVLGSGVSEQFKKLGYADKKDFEWIRIKKRIKLHPDFNTVILSTLESVYALLNYNSKDELVDFLDLSKYNQQICQCTSSVYINKNGIIHCQIESGKPFHPCIDYKVNDKGKFEIVDQFTPPNEGQMPPAERLEYIIKKTTEIRDVNLKLYLESDEFTPSNTTFIEEKDIKNILFSKSHSKGIYKTFSDSIEQYTKEEKSLNILGKISDKNNLLLVCNLSSADRFGVIFILNKNHEITDAKFLNVDDPEIDENILSFIK